MGTLAVRLVKTAAASRCFLDRASRRAIIKFVRANWNADGGVCGRDERSDLYYTLFGAFCLRALGAWPPVFRLGRYLRQVDLQALDSIHQACWQLLASALAPKGFPKGSPKGSVLCFKSSGKLGCFAEVSDSGAYDHFMSLLINNESTIDCMMVDENMPTTGLAAAALSGANHPDLRAWLMRRFRNGGFCAGERVFEPDLLSTGTALFALLQLGAPFDEIREPCLEYVESLWRNSGGFAGYATDSFEDVEYTAYALLSVGCLMAELGVPDGCSMLAKFRHYLKR